MGPSCVPAFLILFTLLPDRTFCAKPSYYEHMFTINMVHSIRGEVQPSWWEIGGAESLAKEFRYALRCV